MGNNNSTVILLIVLIVSALLVVVFKLANNKKLLYRRLFYRGKRAEGTPPASELVDAPPKTTEPVDTSAETAPMEQPHELQRKGA